MSKLSIVLMVCILFIGCGNSDYKRFQEKALDFAESGNEVTSEEYEQLAKIISESSEPAFRLFKNEAGEIDHEKVRDTLVKLFRAKKKDVPPDSIKIPLANTAFALDVYIENSASMDGYVRGVTEFETAIYKMLADFKVKEFCQALNLNYINRSVPYTKANAQTPDIQDFIEKLEPSVFQQRGGDRGVSDIASIIRTVTGKVDQQNAAMLVSDFVFSPGKGDDAEEYLNNQSVGIQIALSEKLRNTDLSVVVIQLDSTFRGFYYDKDNRGIPLMDAKRPYYVWFIGTSGQIKTILDSKILDSIKGGYRNRIVFSSGKNAKPLDYKILLRPRTGEFDLPKGTKGPITEAVAGREKDQKSLFEFYVAVNFSGEIQGLDYFLDKANYRLSDPAYSVEPEAVDPNDRSLAGFTHRLKFSTTELKSQVLKIEIVGNAPPWVEESSSDDDSAIATDDSEKTKTFGLISLIEGVRNAFAPQGASTTNSLSISIEK